MDRHNATLAEVASPVLVRVLVVDPILKIIRQQVLDLDGGAKLEVDLRVFAVEAGESCGLPGC
jgi:hypothetical protein